MPHKHTYRDELRKILITYSIGFTLISLILIYTFIGIYSNIIIRENNADANAIATEEICHEIDSYIRVMDTLEHEPIIERFFETGEQQSQVYERFYAINNQRKVKSIFYIVDTRGRTILTNNYIDSPYNNVDLFLSGLFKQMKFNPDRVVTMSNKVQIGATKRTVYSIGKSYNINDEIKGYIVFDILESDLNKIVHMSDVDILVITDQYNNVILSTNSLVLDEIGKINIGRGEKDQIEFNNKKYYQCKSKILDGKLIIYTLSELELVTQLMTVSILFFVGVMVILTLIIFRFADYVSKKKTESIEMLIDSINRAQEGDLKAFVDIRSNDEFEVIGNRFNDMLVKLNKLMNKNSELIDRNRISEIKQLEAQFNPHFIFNTLEILKYTIHINAPKASDIIVNFANILRYSIDYNTKDIVLEEDLSHLKSYLMIQKCRFNQKLIYQIDVDEAVKTCLVPKLIIQPIIENCINHGYKLKDTLHIDIDIRLMDQDLVMMVMDDGDGIEPQRLAEIRKLLKEKSIISNSIGLNNVHRRIRLLYGKCYGLTIESVIGKGTTVIVKLPYNKENQDV